MSMKQYESYKDSGIDWLGKIPSHWTIVPFKRLFSFGRGLSITKADLVNSGLPVISYGQIHSKTNPSTHIENHLLRYVPESFAEGNDASLAKIGDVLFADTSEDIEGCGNCVYVDKDMTLYAGYHTIIAKNLVKETSNYIAYLFKTDCWRSQLRASVNGVKVYSITQSNLGETVVLTPPFSEQQIIASYLDNKVSQIDAIISEKEKMVEDLQTYRKSLISETVTLGLNPDASMKDSGIDWIGMIPEHWNCAMLKYYLSQPLQYGANESAESETKEWPRYIRITDITDSGKLKDDTFKSLSPEKAKDYILEKGDILFARSGATVGKTYIFKEDYPACFAGYLIKARCNSKLLPDYLYLFTCTNEYDNWKNSVFVQATIQNIGADKYSTMPIIVPPTIEEQILIVEYLNAKLKPIETSISELQSQIEDLKSYKTSVITEAVTGKVDLRNL